MAYQYAPAAIRPAPPPLPAYFYALQQVQESGPGSIPVTQSWARLGTGYQMIVYSPVRMMIIFDQLVLESIPALAPRMRQTPSMAIAYADRFAFLSDLFERTDTALRNGGWAHDLIATVGSISRPPTPLAVLAGAIDCMDPSKLQAKLCEIILVSP